MNLRLLQETVWRFERYHNALCNSFQMSSPLALQRCSPLLSAKMFKTHILRFLLYLTGRRVETQRQRTLNTGIRQMQFAPREALVFSATPRTWSIPRGGRGVLPWRHRPRLRGTCCIDYGIDCAFKFQLPVTDGAKISVCSNIRFTLYASSFVSCALYDHLGEKQRN
jgi:hypothetical protein